MNLTLRQIEAIRAWATSEPLVAEVHLFGSRAKGTARPDSDADIALRFNAPISQVNILFSQYGQQWQTDLRVATDLPVNLAHLAGERTPKHEAAVINHGVKLYP